MLMTILVPLDGSDLAARAVPYASFLARAAGGTLILFHATAERTTDHDPTPEPMVIHDLHRLADHLVGEDVPTTVRADEGDAGPAIVRAISDPGADLVVMSTHGRGGVGRVVPGSVADQVLRYARVPVLMVTANCSRAWAHEQPMRVLVPLDGSPLAEDAIRPSVELARWFPAELWLVRAAEARFSIDALGFARSVPASDAELAAAREYLEKAAAPLRRPGLRVEVKVERGQADDLIAHIAECEAVDLVVTATHGEGGLGRLLLDGMARFVTAGRVPLHLGGVAAASIRRLDVPVLLVCPSSARQAGTTATSDAAAPTRLPD